MKLTPEREATILENIAEGAYRKVAAQAAGISEATLRNWMLRGNSGEQPFAAFADKLRQAEASVEIEAVKRIRGHAQKDWRADAFWLERRMPKTWGPTTRIEIQQAQTELLDAVERVCRAMDRPDVLLAILDELERGGEGTQGAIPPQQ